eukprot:3690951-Alexandrium_andersonii.AAC.1
MIVHSSPVAERCLWGVALPGPVGVPRSSASPEALCALPVALTPSGGRPGPTRPESGRKMSFE